MIGLVLLYWLGKYYYKLAEKHDKSKWGFAILGVAMYYVGTFIAGFIFSVFYITFIGEVAFESFTDVQLSLIALPIGLLTTWGFYQLLKKRWERNKVGIQNAEILDDLEGI